MPNLLETILTCSKPQPPEAVKVDEWGCTVWVKRLNAGEIVRLKALRTEFNADDEDFRMVMECVVDEAGKPVFQSVEQVKCITLKAYNFISNEVVRVNFLSDDKKASKKK